MPIYIKINGMEGNVSSKGHEKWIKVDSLNFAVDRNISTKPGLVSSRESTKPSISELEITKNIDNSSPLLFSEACVGKIKNINIDICQTSETLLPYMQYILSNTIVSGYSISANEEHSGRLITIEKVKLNFSKIEMKYIPFDEKHNPGSPIPAGYNLESAQKI